MQAKHQLKHSKGPSVAHRAFDLISISYFLLGLITLVLDGETIFHAQDFTHRPYGLLRCHIGVGTCTEIDHSEDLLCLKNGMAIHLWLNYSYENQVSPKISLFAKFHLENLELYTV